MDTVATVISPDTRRTDRVPPNQTVTERWPVLHYGSIPRLDLAKWRLTVSGLVEKELSLDLEGFSALPRVKVLSDIHCVTTWSKLDNLWEGVSTGTIRDLVSPLAEARFVIVQGAAGFTTNLPVEDFFRLDVLFALKHDGAPLTPDHGAPVRLVVPGLYFWKSAKWATGLEFTRDDRPGFWESAGYHNRGDPWKEERYSD